jgi:hypothetical protein
MLEWVVQAQKRNIRMTSKMLQDRAKIIADSIGWSAFRGSSGWCVKFLRRNNIKLRSIKRSAQLKAACKEGTSWETRILNPKLDESGALVPDSEEDEEEALGEDEDEVCIMCVCMCVFVCVYLCVCMCVFVCVCIYVYIYICIYMYMPLT